MYVPYGSDKGLSEADRCEGVEVFMSGSGRVVPGGAGVTGVTSGAGEYEDDFEDYEGDEEGHWEQSYQ